jgi:hypothetical protein
MSVAIKDQINAVRREIREREDAHASPKDIDDMRAVLVTLVTFETDLHALKRIEEQREQYLKQLERQLNDQSPRG